MYQVTIYITYIRIPFLCVARLLPQENFFWKHVCKNGVSETNISGTVGGGDSAYVSK